MFFFQILMSHRRSRCQRRLFLTWKNSPKFVESEDLETLPKRQFKTAEIADALMGTEAPINPSDIESLFPKNVKDFQSGFSRLVTRSVPSALRLLPRLKERHRRRWAPQPSQQVGVLKRERGRDVILSFANCKRHVW